MPLWPYSNLILDVLPKFDSCDNVFKNGKCKGKCPGDTYTRNKNAKATSVSTKCSCKGPNCLWAVGRAPVANLYCISKLSFSCSDTKML